MRIGYRAPQCQGMTQDGGFYSFDAQAGRPAAIVMAGMLPPEILLPVCAALQARKGEIAGLDADLVLMVDAFSPSVLDFGAAGLDGVTVVFARSDFFDACGFGSQAPSLFVIDRNQRVMATFDAGSAGDALAEAACATLRQQPREQAQDVKLPAPVLLIPHVFEAAFCRQLIDEFESSAHRPGGMASVDAAGNAVHRIDADKKRREDYVLPPGSATCDRVTAALSEICLPEMRKAFQFDAAYMDRVLIARYDDTGGYFKRHRDNVAPSVAFRQFALSINLNADAYEGGHLLFPEYNGHRYRPPTGGGIIFSASLLHEAAPVTRGSRYVLLTFFHNAEAQARRLAA